jgi:hypothetical protein
VLLSQLLVCLSDVVADVAPPVAALSPLCCYNDDDPKDLPPAVLLFVRSGGWRRVAAARVHLASLLARVWESRLRRGSHACA